jgi:membrane-associated phospholipid phosphatase
MRTHALWLFATSAAATAGYLVLSRFVRRGATRDDDVRTRREILKHATPRAKRLAEATGHIGKWYTHVPAAALGAGLLVKERRHAAGATIAGVSLAAAALSRVLDRVHDHRTPPPGKTRLEPDAQSYPSGHSIETTAATIATAWVLARERVAPRAMLAPIAAVASLIAGLGRLVLDRHWFTDTAAGYCAGIALGTACAGAYELSASER